MIWLFIQCAGHSVGCNFIIKFLTLIFSVVSSWNSNHIGFGMFWNWVFYFSSVSSSVFHLFGWLGFAFFPLYLSANFLSFTFKCIYLVFNFYYHFLISKNSSCTLIVPLKIMYLWMILFFFLKFYAFSYPSEDINPGVFLSYFLVFFYLSSVCMFHISGLLR